MKKEPHLFWQVPGRIAYVVSHSYPYSSNGYAVRTHGIATALAQSGHSVIAINRPGRPWDLPGFPEQDLPSHHDIDGVRYLFLSQPSSRGLTASAWQKAATEALEKTFRLFKPGAVLAASNWENAIPAMQAARKLDLPFYYEVRGFWEISKLARMPEWEDSDEYLQSVNQETLVARSARRVFTLNPLMKNELVKRGVPANNIDLVPNAFGHLPALARPSKSARDKVGLNTRYVVGYIGSFTEYEGLDDLVRACVAARKAGVDVSLLLIGSSSPLGAADTNIPCKSSAELTSLAAALDFQQFLHLPGRVDPQQLGDYYALIDLVVIPRKAMAVTELVSPIKPLEAAAYGKAMLVSDVAPLLEVAIGGGAATFRKSSVEDLAAQLIRLLPDTAKRQEMGEKARAWITQERSFMQVIQPLLAALPPINKRPVPVETPILAPEPAKPASIAAVSSRVAPMQTPPKLEPLKQEPPKQEPLKQELPKQEFPKQEFPKQEFSKKEPPKSAAVKPIPASAPIKAIAPLMLASGKNTLTPDESTQLNNRFEQAFNAGGLAAFNAFLVKQLAGQSKKLAALCQLKAGNFLLNEGEVEAATALADAALAQDSTLTTLRSVTRLYHDATLLDRACELVARLEALQGNLSAADQKFVAEIKLRAQLANWAAQPASPQTLPVTRDRVLNVLAFSLPYTSVGYATRSHGLAIGIRNAGWDIRPYTRPGFPYDFKPELEGQTLPEQNEIDGITYRRIFDIARRGTNETDYLHVAIGHWERIIDQEHPQLVHAASNYVTALPALIAARRKGIPFVYEVRGFWEVTRSSRDEAFTKTSKYRYMEFFEGLVARYADQVITITSAMKEELAKRGVAEDRIFVAFNSVDPSRFVPRPPDTALADRLHIPAAVPVIGYVGSFVDYEGLDDLVTAAAELKNAGHDFRLLMVGDGAVLDALKQQASDLGLTDHAIFTGRVPHDEVENYYSLIDIAPFPRKPWEVCELVSPLKPFEAMALGKAVIVSGTRALTEIVTHNQNGLVFEKGSVADLKQKLAAFLQDRNLRIEIGKRARTWIMTDRSWDVAAKVCVQCYKAAALSTQAAHTTTLLQANDSEAIIQTLPRHRSP